MKSVDQEALTQEYVERWLRITRKYLLPQEPGSADAADRLMHEPKLDTHGAQDRFVSRARGRLQRLLQHTPQRERDPLQELERTFYLQASLISSYPEVPRRLLAWLLQDGDTRLRRRVQKVISHHQSRLSRIIGHAKQQGLVRAEVEPQTAASLFIGMLQAMALRMGGDPRERELLLRASLDVFAAYKAQLAYA